MGNKAGNGKVKFYPNIITLFSLCQGLPQSVKDNVVKLFNLIDHDGSKTIDKHETLKFWSSNFAKLNTNELFDQVDKNNDGTIQMEEWIEFWTTVYLSGYSEEELNFELDNLINHGSWVKFETTDKKGFKKSTSLKPNGKK